MAEKFLCEIPLAEKNRTIDFGKWSDLSQDDPEVTSHDNISINPNYHSHAPHSDLNTEHKTEEQSESQQLLNNSEANITTPSDESLTPRIKVK